MNATSISSSNGRNLRVLIVQGGPDGSLWVADQIDSLKQLGVAADFFMFEQRRSFRGLAIGGWAIRRRARELGVDLIHVHYGAAQALAAVLFSPKPVVISFCGSDLLGNYDSYGRRTWSGQLSRFLSRLAALGARRCIAKTEQLRQTLWLRSCRSKCEVIPNGVDLNLFRPQPQFQARHALGWSNDGPVLLFMDRKGAWVKDPALAHAAFEIAKKKVPSLKMYIVESEPHDRMPLFYNAADVLLLTSRHEGSNNTVKEAMACNLPIVATACGDIPERLHRVNWSYVCPRDPAVLGARLVEIAIARQRSNGREHISDLALHHIASKVRAFYDKAVASHAIRPIENSEYVGKRPSSW